MARKQYTSIEIGSTIKIVRQDLGLTQKDLALATGSGLRFIIDLEKGKPTCQLEKVLMVINTLGITIKLTKPYKDE